MPKTAFIREKLNEWNATIKYIATDKQLADGLTKTLRPKQFEEMCTGLHLIAKGEC